MYVLFLRSLLRPRVALTVELKMKAVVTVIRWAMIFLMMMELMKESALKATVQQRGSLKLAVRRYGNTGVWEGWAGGWSQGHSWQDWPAFATRTSYATFPAVHHHAQQEKLGAFQSCCCSEAGGLPLHHCSIIFFVFPLFIKLPLSPTTSVPTFALLIFSTVPLEGSSDWLAGEVLCSWPGLTHHKCKL